MGNIDWPADDTLLDWYEDETHREIADRLDCSKSAVGRRLRKLNADARKAAPRPEVMAEISSTIDWRSLCNDDQALEDALSSLLSERDGPSRSVPDIADRLDCSETAVRNKLDELDIDTGDVSYDKYDWPSDETLADMSKRLSIRGIVDELPFDPSPSAVSRRLSSIEGAETGIFNGERGKTLSRTDRRFLRYTRWAAGLSHRSFVSVFDLAIHPSPLLKWETGRGCDGSSHNPNVEHVDVWHRIVAIGKRHGVDPSRPRRHLYWDRFVEVLDDLRVAIDGIDGWYDLSTALGFDRKTIPRWKRGERRPRVSSHKTVRESAELHGVWDPPPPVTEEGGGEEGEPDEPELSEQDRETIRSLAASTNISDIAMMYDLHLSTVSDILRDG